MYAIKMSLVKCWTPSNYTMQHSVFPIALKKPFELYSPLLRFTTLCFCVNNDVAQLKHKYYDTVWNTKVACLL